MNTERAGNGRRPSWVYWLLILPFIAMLWVSSYASATPRLGGIPFFFWYQFLWVFITVAITGIVYFLGREV